MGGKCSRFWSTHIEAIKRHLISYALNYLVFYLLNILALYKYSIMQDELFFSPAYKGSRKFSQQQARTVDATGFGAAADDYAERGIDLNEQLIQNKPATYFFRMKGDAMMQAGIHEGDMLIVDRSVKVSNGSIIVAQLQGEMIVRRFHKNFHTCFLVPENPAFKSINLDGFTDFSVWGVVRYSIHAV